MAPVVDSYSSTLTPDLLARLIIAIVLGYSGRWNARRLENPFHAFWNTVFAEWISDLHPYAVLIPQYQIDTIPQTLGPDDSMGTITRGDAKELTPDFVIVIAQLISRTTTSPILPTTFPPHFSSWRDVKLSELKLPFLAELKRPPARSLVSQELFIERLFSLLTEAHEQLMDQSEYVFIKYPYMGEIIVIACVGEWWSWRIATQAPILSGNTIVGERKLAGRPFNLSNVLATRNTRPSPTDNISLAAGSRSARMGPPVPATPPPADSRGYRRKPLSKPDLVPYKGNTHSGRRRTPAEKEAAEREKMEQARIQNFHRHEDLPANVLEQPGGDEESVLKRLRTAWSACLLYGTPASNEHFSIIHHLLEKQMPQFSTRSHGMAAAEREPTDESEYELEDDFGDAEDKSDGTESDDEFNLGSDMDMSY